MKHLFTSEAVSEGHPDKIADQISDAILDECLRQDSKSRVACEVFVSGDFMVIGGEITTKAQVDFEKVARHIVKKIGYTKKEYGLDANTMKVCLKIKRQSNDIAMGVNADKKKTKGLGAGDQGLMFGYACDETLQLMPLALIWSNAILQKAAQLRKTNKKFKWLRPDAKSQVTVEYDNDKIINIHTVVVSHQHDDKYDNGKEITQEFVKQEIKKHIIEPVLKKIHVCTKNTIYHINPTGRFVTGGTEADTGLTGRKIIADTYGGVGRHGGGSFSGKDASKVDRCASYMARYIAKNVVAAKIAKRCEIQLAYAIGIAEPVSVAVFVDQSCKISNEKISYAIQKVFPLTPEGIIKKLQLCRPIFSQTATYGHFGKTGSVFTWEKTDAVQALFRALNNNM